MPVRDRDALVGELQRSFKILRFLSHRSDDLRSSSSSGSHVSFKPRTMRQMNRICETRRSVGVGGFSTDVLVAPVRGSSTGVRTNTIQGVKPERGWRSARDPSQVLRKKIFTEDPEEFITGTWMDGCFSFRYSIPLAKKFNRGINGRFCEHSLRTFGELEDGGREFNFWRLHLL